MVENKQKFISQIMTSKSPVRTAEDIDETALSYAEIKMLATGNPYIKEKMDLDIQVSKLKLLKQNFLSEKYALEDKIIKYYPAEIKRYEERIKGHEEDVKHVNELPTFDGNNFAGMKVGDVLYSEKTDAGSAILTACKNMRSPEQVPLGEYMGFETALSFDTVSRKYEVELKHSMRYRTELGDDPVGNITRINNLISGVSKRLESVTNQYENVIKQFETAKVEVKKEFPQDEELSQKMKRLDELNILLNMDEKSNEIVDEREESEPEHGAKEAEIVR